MSFFGNLPNSPHQKQRKRKLELKRRFAMKNFLFVVPASISLLAAVLYGGERLDPNDFLFRFPSQIRAVYNIEQQENKQGISLDAISMLEENHMKFLDNSFKENLFQIKRKGKNCSVFKGELCLFSGLYDVTSFMSNSEAVCFLAAGSNKAPFGIHRVDRGDPISDYEQLKLYVHQTGSTQKVSFPRNFYPSRLFLSSKGKNIFIKGTMIEITKEGFFSGIIADNAYLFYDMKLRRLYPVFVFSAVDSTVSAKVLDLSTDKTAFVLLESVNGRGHNRVLFEIVIDRTHYIIPTISDL